MNVRFSSVLCSVLIYGIISCSADSAEYEKQGHECIGQYLKSKGIIEYEATMDKKSSLCLPAVEKQLVRLREVFAKKMEEELPNDSACLVEEFNKGRIVDIVMTAAFYQSDDRLTDNERKPHYDDLQKEGDEEVTKMSFQCGVRAEILDALMDTMFSSNEDTSE